MKKRTRSCLWTVVMAMLLVGILTCGALATDTGATIEGEGDDYTVTYNGAATQEGEQYLLLVVRTGVELTKTTDDDILYVDQKEASSGGAISFHALPKSTESGDVYLCGSFTTGNSPLYLGTTKGTAGVTITKQPVDVTVPAGATATFSVEASGSNLKYQWQYWNGSGWTNTDLPGNDTAKMSFNTWEGADGLAFHCVIWNSQSVAYSDTVWLKIGSQVTITEQPKVVETTVGGYASFHVGATGDGLKYQWQYWNGSGWTNTDLPGNDTDTMAFTTWADVNGLAFHCVVWNLESVAYSDTVWLTLTSEPSAITAQPKTISVVGGQIATFSVETTGTVTSYLWRYWDDAKRDWTNADTGILSNPGARTSSISFMAWTAANNLTVDCVVTFADGTVLYSDVATLYVSPSLTKTLEPIDQTVTAGETATFRFTAAGEGTINYQWQYWNGSGWTNTDLPGNDTDTMAFTTWAGGTGIAFHCVAWNENSVVFSNIVWLTVTP